MTELGHVVYYVRSVEESLRFYTQAVGLSLRGKLFGGRGALLAGKRTHHELLLIQVGDADGPSRENAWASIMWAGRSARAWPR